jgi:hypothetical protein
VYRYHSSLKQLGLNKALTFYALTNRFPDGSKQLLPEGVVTMTDDGFFVSETGTRSTLITKSSTAKQASVKKAKSAGDSKAHQRLKTAAKGCAKLDFSRPAPIIKKP